MEVGTIIRVPDVPQAAPGRMVKVRCVHRDVVESQDESLKCTFKQVRTIAGQPLHPGQPLTYPYFAIIKDRLYRVTQDAQTKEDTTQLLVPRSRREMFFQASHSNPITS